MYLATEQNKWQNVKSKIRQKWNKLNNVYNNDNEESFTSIQPHHGVSKLEVRNTHHEPAARARFGNVHDCWFSF